MITAGRRRSVAPTFVLGLTALISSCSSQSNTAAVETVIVTETATSRSTSNASSTPATPTSDCEETVVALDPGHNGATISDFDPITGVAMRDYPNGAEDADVLAVANTVKVGLERAGYRVVLLKKSTGESVTYRERVTRAEQAGADIGISIHTSPGEHSVFDQRLGGYRAGTGTDGTFVRVVFTNPTLAAKSGRMSAKFAGARTRVERRPVNVVQNNFGGRAPLWEGNLPMISLISQKVPWVYSEFGSADGAGGANPIGPSGRAEYAKSVIAGTKAALPIKCGR